MEAVSMNAFADVFSGSVDAYLQMFGEDITLGTHEGAETVCAIVELDEPRGDSQQGLIQYPTQEEDKLNLDTSPIQVVVVRDQVWHLSTPGPDEHGFREIAITLHFGEHTHTNIHDLNDEQIRWTDE